MPINIPLWCGSAKNLLQHAIDCPDATDMMPVLYHRIGENILLITRKLFQFLMQQETETFHSCRLKQINTLTDTMVGQIALQRGLEKHENLLSTIIIHDLSSEVSNKDCLKENTDFITVSLKMIIKFQSFFSY